MNEPKTEPNDETKCEELDPNRPAEAFRADQGRAGVDYAGDDSNDDAEESVK